MRAIIQRVSRATVHIQGGDSHSIQRGCVILLGVEPGDSEIDAAWLMEKILKLRLFDDEDGLMNLSLSEVGGELLVISQFTLFASTKKGTRPSFHRAAKPEQAQDLYESFIRQIQNTGSVPVKSGTFGAHMDVDLVNDGPVTLILDSKNRE